MTVTEIGQLNPTLKAHLQMLSELFQNHPGSCQDGQEMKAALQTNIKEVLALNLLQVIHFGINRAFHIDINSTIS